MGCHGNHAFKHSQNKFLAGDMFFFFFVGGAYLGSQ